MSGNYYCCVCGKPATVCKKETINGVTKVSYFCDECFALLENGHPFESLMSAMFNSFGNNGTSIAQKRKMRVCSCGMTERDILNGGKFGCSECYKVFSDIVENYVNSRGYLAHKGKSPKNYSGKEKVATNTNVEGASGMSQLDRLKAELQVAVKEERYLDADRISKQIAALNKESKWYGELR